MRTRRPTRSITANRDDPAQLRGGATVHPPRVSADGGSMTEMETQGWLKWFVMVRWHSCVSTYGQYNFTLGVYAWGWMGAPGKVSWIVYNGTNSAWGYAINSTCNVTDGNWHHVAGVREGSTIKLYVDGQMEQSTHMPADLNISNSSSLWIGAAYTGGWSFNGSIDEVHIWKRALSAEEIRLHYLAGAHGLESKFTSKGDQVSCAVIPDEDNSLVAYWSFDEGYGDTAYDVTGRNNGTRTNVSWTSSAKKFGALEFNGNKNFISIKDDSSLDITGDITIAAWISAKPLSEGTGILGKDAYSYNVQLLASGIIRFQFSDSDNTETYTQSNSAISSSTWYHIVVTRTGNTNRIYIDGNMNIEEDKGTSGLRDNLLSTSGS